MTALNSADKLAIGSAQATAAYVGSTKVWPPFKQPTDIAGCAIWLDASKLALANGAAVTSWANLGSGSQPTITPSPTFRTNALKNTMPVVRITQGTGKIRFSGTGVNKDWTLIYIGRRWKLSAGRIVAAHGSAANLLVGYHGNEMNQCYVEGWLTPQTPTATIQWKLYSADSTATAVARYFSNGVLFASGAATPANGWGGTLCISGYLDDPNVATSQECDCEIAELVMYNRKLSDAERQTVENYLRTKWNPISLFKPSDYAGIYNIGWFDASDASSIITTTGVYRWGNKSGGGFGSLAQDTDAYQPSYANQTVTVNSPQLLTAPSAPASFDIAWVGKPNPASVGEWRTLIRNVTSPHLVIIESGTTRFGVYNGGFFPAGSLTWDNVRGIGYGRFAGGADAVLSRDGGPMTSAATTIASGNAVPSYFGGYQGPPPSQGWGEINEMVFSVYNSDGCRQLIEGYLAWKWGLVGLLPADHPYKSAAP